MYILPQFKADELLVYLRKSRTDDPLLTVEEVLERHEKQIDAWVAQNVPDGPVPEQNRYREVVSGETLDSRPKMQELLRRIETPKVKAILIKECSRLSRGDLEDIGYLVKVLRYTNTIVITMDRGAYDLNDDRDREDFERELMRGNDYLEYTKKILNAGKLASVKEGHFLYNAPYGYKKIEVKEGSGRSYFTLEPIPDQAAAVKRVFELYSQGLGYSRISQHLDDEHFPPPKGGKWTPETIPKMIENEHYIGKVRWQARKVVMRVEDGQVIKTRPRNDDYLLFEGKHPAIISQELWDKVQDMKGKVSRTTDRKELSNPLAGIMRCSCGRMMTRRVYLNKDGTEKAVARFYCSDRRHCGTSSTRSPDLMADVVQKLKETIEDFEVRVKNGSDDCAEQHRQLIDRLEKKLVSLQDLEAKQWDEKLKGAMPPHIFDRLNAQTVTEIEEVQHALYEAKSSMPEPVDLQERIVTFQAALDALQDPDVPVKKANLLLKECIELIVYHRDKYSNGGSLKKGIEPPPVILKYTLRI